MKKYTYIFIVIILANCSRPLYIKDKHFNCGINTYEMDSDLKELVYKTIKRAVVVEKDIPDYNLLWKKHRIYILDEYQLVPTIVTQKVDSINKIITFNSERNIKHFKTGEIPNKIGNVSFCLKSKIDLQKISNKTREDFLHLSFSFIKIEGNIATVKINNSWIVSKHRKKGYLSGGGYTCTFKKINGKWEFDELISSWIS